MSQVQRGQAIIMPGTYVQTVTGNSGGAVSPDGGGNLDLIGSGALLVTGFPGINTLVISDDGTLPTTFTEDSGSATPALNNLNIVGGTGVITSGAASTVTISLDGAVVGQTITGNTGGALSPTAGNWNIVTANSTAIFSGAVSTETLDFRLDNLLLGASGSSITTATLNVGVGKDVLASLVNGAANCAIGYLSLNLCDDGGANTALGFEVLPQITTGSGNTGAGTNCLNSLLAGASYNTCYGQATLSGLISGQNNIAIGNGTGQAYNAAQSDNILIGKSSVGLVGDDNTIRIGETGSGDGQQNRCFIAAIDGVDVGNTAKVVTMGTGATVDQLGTATLTAGAGVTITPTANTITIAVTAGATVVETITGNTGGAISPTLGNINVVTANSTPVFAGAGSTETLDFGLTNLVLGSSMPLLAGGNSNVGLGLDVLSSITTQVQNTAVGFNAGKAIVSGSNVAIGAYCLDVFTTGAAGVGANTGVGTGVLHALTTGTRNSAFGLGVFQYLLTGSWNIGIGTQNLGGQITGNTYTSSESSNILINNIGVVGESNKIRIGTSGTGQALQNACYIAGIDGVNIGSVAKVLTMASEQIGTATITAGTNISVTPGANTITIAATGSGSFAWSVITVNQTAAVNNGYLCNKAGTLALALPAVSVIGDMIEVTNENTALGVQFTQAAGQQILIGNTNTTLGATGTLTSSAVGDTLKLVCYTANTVWRVTSGWGNWTPA